MYEHPMKRFGLSMNRIVYSNTAMVQAGFPVPAGKNINKMGITFRYRTFANAKLLKVRTLTTEEHMDELLPSSIKE